jgi:hypothetical protein
MNPWNITLPCSVCQKLSKIEIRTHSELPLGHPESLYLCADCQHAYQFLWSREDLVAWCNTDHVPVQRHYN